MQYIQLQQQPEGDIPNASASGSMNLFVTNGVITLKDNTGLVLPQGGSGSVLDNLQMELGWGSGSTIGVNGERVRLLDLNANINDILTGTTGDEVWLIIERYRSSVKKKDLSENPMMRNAGWKHDVNTDGSSIDRPSEIQLFSASNNNFYFGQDKYFNVFYNDINRPNLGGMVGAKGLKRYKANYNSAYVYLRFSLKIGSDINGWLYTKPLAKINMTLQFNGLNTEKTLQLNYKYV